MNATAVPVEPDDRVAAGSSEDWPSPRIAWTALILLMMGAIVSTLDRGIFNLLVQPITKAFSLSDTQFGAIQSFAFGLFYTTMAIPIGILADRFDRRLLVGIGISIFSFFAISTGLVRTYAQLFLCRVGVGIGEASLNPTAFSLVGDLFPPRKQGRAVSMFITANFVGSSIALAVGGLLIGWLDGVAVTDPAALHGLAPWQAAIILAALPGAILAPCYFLLRDPPRRGLAGKSPKISFRETFRELGHRRKFLILLIGGMAAANTLNYAVGGWMPALFIRVYGWSATEIGLFYGIGLLIGGTGGSLLGGWLTDTLSARGRLQAPVEVVLFGFVCVGVLEIAAPLMPSAGLALACYAPVMVLKSMAFTAGPTAIQLVTPNQLRAQTSALYFTTISLVGGTGPVVIGFMTDRLFSSPTDVRYSMALLTAIIAPIMITMLFLALRPYRDLRARLG